MDIDGTLVLFHYPLVRNAGTILENIFSFRRHSKHQIWYVNTEFEFPAALRGLSFKSIVLHYSIFGIYPWKLSQAYIDYLTGTDAAKLAFFQDEYRFCRERFDFINQCGIDCIFTLIEEEYFDQTYRKYTNAREVITVIPGYVSEELLVAKDHLAAIPDEARQIDISYRGRTNPAYLGRASYEKREIGLRFRELASRYAPDLTLDIEVEEEKRIYGLPWLQFMASSKAALGVESGSSIYDVDGLVYRMCEEAYRLKPDITFEQMYEIFLHKYEGGVQYAMISPRHFEAAALNTCQILFEGKYSGLMRPGVHYIELKKDFSNFAEVLEQFRNVELRRRLVRNTYRDLIESGMYTYQYFVQNRFDPVLERYIGNVQATAFQQQAADQLHEAQMHWWQFATAT